MDGGGGGAEGLEDVEAAAGRGVGVGVGVDGGIGGAPGASGGPRGRMRGSLGVCEASSLVDIRILNEV